MAVRIPSPELLKTVCKCQDCHLHETADNPFIGGRWVNENNHSDAPLLCCVGEAPGRVEDSVGACFQNTSLKNLEKALGENINDVYLTNICRCVPWADPCQKYKVRKPTPIEMQSCLPWLLLEISKFPEGTPVVAMGATAFQALMPSLASSRITEIAGREFDLVIHRKHHGLYAYCTASWYEQHIKISDHRILRKAIHHLTETLFQSYRPAVRLYRSEFHR